MLYDDGSMIELPQLVLASGSPRRSEILRSVGWPFIKSVPNIDETQRENETPEDYVARLAEEKVLAVSRQYSNMLVLAADTTVVVDDQILGKPTDLDDAKRMIKLLSGRWHDVLTGVAIKQSRDIAIGVERTGVKFSDMNDAEVEFLARMGDPLDKAGAYAVQAQAALFIEQIRGDYWNVVGLPISLVYRLLKK